MQKNAVKNAVVVGALVVGGMAPVIMSYSDDVGADERAKQEMKIQGANLEAENTEETGTNTKVEVDGELVEETESEPEKEATESEQAESTESEPEEEKTEGEQVESTESEQKDETDSKPEKEEEGEQTEEETEEETGDLAEAKRLHKEVAEKLSGKDKADFTEEDAQLYNDYISARAKLYPVNETEGNIEDIVTLPYQDEQVVPEDELPLTEFGDLDFVKYHEIAQGRALPRPLSAVENDLYAAVSGKIYPRSYYVEGSLGDLTLVWELMTLEQRQLDIAQEENFKTYDVKHMVHEYYPEEVTDYTYVTDMEVDNTSQYTVDEFNMLPDSEVAKLLGYNKIYRYKIAPGEVIKGKMVLGDTYENYIIQRIPSSEKGKPDMVEFVWDIGDEYNSAQGWHEKLVSPEGVLTPYRHIYSKANAEDTVVYRGEFLFSIVPVEQEELLNIELPESKQFQINVARESKSYIKEPEEVEYIPEVATPGTAGAEAIPEIPRKTTSVEVDGTDRGELIGEDIEDSTEKGIERTKDSSDMKYQKTGISAKLGAFASVILGSVLVGFGYIKGRRNTEVTE